jgi:hypothetical protein
LKKLIFIVGKDIDPNCLYNPKPSNNSTVIMNDNTIPGGSLLSQTRPFAQSVRVNPSVIQQPITGTIKSTKTQVDNRRGNIK